MLYDDAILRQARNPHPTLRPKSTARPTLSFGSAFGASNVRRAASTPLGFGQTVNLDPWGMPLGVPWSTGTTFVPSAQAGRGGKQAPVYDDAIMRQMRNPPPQMAVNTASVDGASNFQNGLSGLASSVMQSMGVRPDGPSVGAVPASFGVGGNDEGMNWMLILGATAVVGGLIYFATT